MKKSIIVLLSVLICASTINFASAKTTSNQTLASAIKMYKAGNYSGCYTTLNEIISKDPSNVVAYYYLAITSAQIGKKDEAISNYEKVINLSPNTQVGLYATRGKTCLEEPDKCGEESVTSTLDNFVQSKFGTGFSEEARGEYEKHKIENLMREMNRKDDMSPRRFKDYKDFSSEVPTNDEIVTALRILQKAGFGDMLGGNTSNMSDFSLLTGNQDNNAMLNMLMRGNSSISPQVIQSMLTNQMSANF